MESYIVRIYREDEKSPQNLIGIVEEVGSDEQKVFTNVDELWSILSSLRRRQEKNGKRRNSPLKKGTKGVVGVR